MNGDIATELLEKIQREYSNRVNKSKNISDIQSKIAQGTATYVDAQAFSIEAGEILASIFKEYLSADLLPEGRMHYDIADRILRATLGDNHKLIKKTTVQIQELLNNQAGLGLKSVDVPLNGDKIKSMVNRISNEENFDDIAWMLDAPVVTFSQSVVVEILKANVEFQGKSGMKPVIKRTLSGHKACDWCRSLAGTYEYPDVPEDVYRRHNRCKCPVYYYPSENKKQDVWTKEWETPKEKEKRELRKTYGLK